MTEQKEKKNLYNKTFLYRKMLHIFRKCIRKNLVYIFTFVFQFLYVAYYMKCINETTTPTELSPGFIDSVLRPKILGNRMDFYFYFSLLFFHFLLFGYIGAVPSIFFKLHISLIYARKLERTVNF